MLISKFNAVSRDMFLHSDRTLLGSKVAVKSVRENTTILLFDYEAKEYFGIAIVGTFEDGSSCRENYIPNIDGTYTGEYAMYNKFEIPVCKFYKWKMSCERLVSVMGIDSKHINNIVKNGNTSFAKPFYGSQKETDLAQIKENKRVLDIFHFIVETVLERVD